MDDSNPIWHIRRHVGCLGQNSRDVAPKVTAHKFALLTWFLCVAAFGSWLAVMAADNEPPYIYNVEASRVIPDPAPQGSVITVEWSLAKVNRICPGTVSRYFRDMETGDIVATMDAVQMSRGIERSPGHVTRRLPRSFELPPALPPVVGYSVDVCASCNLLQRVFPLCFRTPQIVFRTKPADKK